MANSKTELKTWANVVFLIICAYSFLAALVITLKIPIKIALIFGLSPLGLAVVLYVLLFFFFKFELSIWKKIFKEVSSDESVTAMIRTLMFPCLLVLLYFFVRMNDADGKDGQQILFTSSPARCEMVLHPCGASYKLDSPGEVWDAADLISQPSATEVYIITNLVEIKQTRDQCAQTGAYCSIENINPGKIRPRWLGNVSWTFSHEFSRTQIWNPISCANEPCLPGILYDNGIQTETCSSNKLCNIEGWCPPVSLANFSPDPIFETSGFSIFLDLRPNFPDFKGVSWTQGGKGGYSANYADIYARHYKYTKSVETCVYSESEDPFCPRFLMKDIVSLAGANYADASAYGGQFKVEVNWRCTFDWGQDIYDCLPNFKFINRENNQGKPKIYSEVTKLDADNRAVTYSLGISISVEHVGKGLQIQVVNFVLYAQFIYVSYAMIKGPFLWLLRCFYTTVKVARSQKATATQL